MRGNKVEKCFSLKELNDRAKAAPVESTPIRFYIRSAEQLFKQVHFSFSVYSSSSVEQRLLTALPSFGAPTRKRNSHAEICRFSFL